jgi:threonine/homoserine/homoserine lactone efflux protein
VTWGEYSSYLLIVVVVVLAPGADTMIVLRNALRGGARAGVLAIAGIGSASLMQGRAAAQGLGALVLGSQPVFTALRWFGVAYLCYIGVQALRSAWRGEYSRPEALTRGGRGAGRRAFREGLLTNITNPKVLALYLSVLPQFLHSGASSTLDALLLAYTVAVLGAVWLLILVLVVHRVRGWLQQRRVRRSVDATTGGAMLGFGVALMLE